MEETIIALFTEHDLCAAMGARTVHPQNIRFRGVCTDSRKATSDDLFVALSGERFDAHDFVPDVVQKGCRGVLVSRELDIPDTVVQFVVDDVLRAFGRLASAILDRRRALGGFTTYAVTGSNGKTTTKEILSLLLAAQGHRVLKTEGNFNNFVGLPMTAVRLCTSHDVAVLEMGANAPGEIAYLSTIGKPDIAIITCIGSAHLEGFGSIEGVARAKGEMLDAPGLRAAILPAQTRRYYEGRIPATVTPVWVGGEGESEAVSIRDVRQGLDGIDFDVIDRGATKHVHLPLLGAHNAGNLARAYAAATVDGTLSANEITAAVAAIRLPSGRLERWTAPEVGSFLHDAYNANPSSMAEAMHLMAQIDAPKCLILGDMRELGPTSSELHRELGQKAAAVHPLRILCVGDHADDVRHGAVEAGMNPQDIACTKTDRLDEGLAWIRDALSAQTVCLIKGSRGIRLERVLEFFHAQRQ